MNRSKDKDNEKKLMNEYCQRKLTKMLQDEDNKYCVDCDAKGPRWVSWNLGVFLCIRCAGIHRNLGVHISRVKSVNLDSWTPEQVVSLEQMGNSRARAVYEANVPDNFRRPQTDSSLESFIRAKYEQKKYIAKEWVPTPIPTKVDWEKEMEDELEKQKKKKKTPSVTSGTPIAIPAPVNDKKSVASKTASIPPPLSKSGNFNSPKSGRTERKSASSDLLGLNTSAITEPTKVPEPILSDNFANFLSSAATENSVPVEPSAVTTKSDGFSSLDKEEADFFNQTPASKEAAAKLTKDSILALYSAGPTIPAINPINSYPNFNGGGVGAAAAGQFGMTGFMPTAAPQAYNNQFVAQPHHQQQQQPWPAQTTGVPQWTNPSPFAAFAAAAPNPTGPVAPASANDSISKHFGSLNLNNVWQ